MKRSLAAVIVIAAAVARAEHLPSLAGPAFGTTYRVTLAREIPGRRPEAVHREVEAVIARIDRAASTWRDDSDASRFNRAAAGEWIEVSQDLVVIVEVARRVHEMTDGAFDITIGATGVAAPGMDVIESRHRPPALRKARAGVTLDLGGIGPGYAVDMIGARLVALGSRDHLVELGGEVRGWGRRPDGGAWRVHVAGAGEVALQAPHGPALATSTARPGTSPIDPRTGRVAECRAPSATVRAASCAEADALAVAALVLGLEPGPDGLSEAPSTPEARPAATRAAP